MKKKKTAKQNFNNLILFNKRYTAQVKSNVKSNNRSKYQKAINLNFNCAKYK